MWNTIAHAPEHLLLRLAVIEAGEEHVLIFPCRLENGQWINPSTGAAVAIHPTHWQDWAPSARKPADGREAAAAPRKRLPN